NDANYSMRLTNGSANLIGRNTFNNATYGLWTRSEMGDKVIDSAAAGLFSTKCFYSYRDLGALYRGDSANGGYYGSYFSAPSGIRIDGGKANHNVTSGIYLDQLIGLGRWGGRILNSTANDNGDYGMYAAYPVVSGDNT